MVHVILIILAIMVLEIFLAKYLIAGLMIPMASMFGMIVAGMMLLAPSSDGWQDVKSREAFLLFIILTAGSFLIYYWKRRKEHQEGYLNTENAENKRK